MATKKIAEEAAMTAAENAAAPSTEGQPALEETPVKTPEELHQEALAAKAEAEAKEKARLEEKVPIRLFKDNDRYKDDVYVCVNGERLLIKRGENVEIPRKFALVLEQSAQQDTATANLIEQKSTTFAAEAAAHNV
jgi:hypothetical protein|nr:MAG TPA: hypothetical protein [Caudoviricetes sp.]